MDRSEKRKADALYQKVLSIRLLCYTGDLKKTSLSADRKIPSVGAKQRADSENQQKISEFVSIFSTVVDYYL